MQKNDYLIAKFGVDTAENEPLQVWGVDAGWVMIDAAACLRACDQPLRAIQLERRLLAGFIQPCCGNSRHL